jgi:hypothetical protein
MEPNIHEAAGGQYNLLTGQEGLKYGAFMGTHLKAISQISQHADEISMLRSKMCGRTTAKVIISVRSAQTWRSGSRTQGLLVRLASATADDNPACHNRHAHDGRAGP